MENSKASIIHGPYVRGFKGDERYVVKTKMEVGAWDTPGVLDMYFGDF